MKKRILSILLCICLLCSILSSTMVYAADYGSDVTSDVESGSDTTPLASGTCGDGVTWSLSEDYVLTISGDGPMENYVSYSRQPWKEYSYYIVRVEVEEGVTTIGDNAFWGFYDLESISLPDSLTAIGKQALMWCDRLMEVTIPANVTTIGDYAVAEAPIMEKIVFLGDKPEFGKEVFRDAFAVAYYPADNESWNGFFADETIADFGLGGNLLWRASGIGDVPFVTENGILFIPNDTTGMGDGWCWDDCVLMLDGSAVNETGDFPVKAIRFMSDISSAKIVLNGDVTLDSTDIGIDDLPVIQLMGSGDPLKISTGSFKLTINSAGDSYGANAINTMGEMTIVDSTLEMNSNYGGILVERGNLQIIGSTVTSKGGRSDAIEVNGIRDSVEGYLIDAGKLSITDSVVEALESGSNAIYCDGDMVITNSKVTATTLDGNNGFGNDCGNLVFTDSDITAIGEFIGICTYGTITVNNCNVVAKGNPEDEDSYAIRIGSRDESEEETARVEDFVLVDCEFVTPENAEIIAAVYEWAYGGDEIIVVVDDNDETTEGWVTEVVISNGSGGGSTAPAVVVPAAPVVTLSPDLMTPSTKFVEGDYVWPAFTVDANTTYCNSYWEKLDPATGEYVPYSQSTPDNLFGFTADATNFGMPLWVMDEGNYRYRTEAVNTGGYADSSLWGIAYSEWTEFTVGSFEPAIPVTAINIPTELTLAVGETIDIIATVSPDGAEYRSLMWMSDFTTNAVSVVADTTNSLMATITANTVGTSYISVCTVDGDVWAYCTVTVVERSLTAPAKPVVMMNSGYIEGDYVNPYWGSVDNADSFWSYWEKKDSEGNYVQYSNSSDDFWQTMLPGHSVPLWASESGEYRYRLKAVNTATGEETYSDWMEFTVSEYVPVVAPTDINMPEALEIWVGETLEFLIYPVPENADYRYFVLFYDNTEVISAALNGNVVSVKALASGEGTIYVYTADGDICGTCRVTVPSTAPGKPSAVLQRYYWTNPVEPKNHFVEGEMAWPMWSDLGLNSHYRNSYWEIYDEETGDYVEYATYLRDKPKDITLADIGTGVYLTEPGTLRYRVESVNESTGENAFSDWVYFTVEEYVPAVEPTGIKLNYTEVTIKERESISLIAQIVPSNADFRDFFWIVSEGGEEVIDLVEMSYNAQPAQGDITGLKAGTVVVTVKTLDGDYSASCVVTVIENTAPVKPSAFLTEDIMTEELVQAYEFGEGDTAWPVWTLGDNTDYCNSYWEYYNTQARKYESYGVIAPDNSNADIRAGIGTGMALMEPGTYRYRVEAVNKTTGESAYSDWNYVNVADYVPSVPTTDIILDDEIIILLGECINITAKVQPENADFGRLIWSVDDKSVAQLGDGPDAATLGIETITGLSVGETTLSVMTYDGDVQATCSVKVVAGPIIEVQPESITVMHNQNATFSVRARGNGDLSYQWEEKTPDGEWTSMGEFGAAEIVAIAAPVGIERNGYQYRCVVSDANGNVAVSEPATLTVEEPTEPEKPEAVLATVVNGAFEARDTFVEGDTIYPLWTLGANTDYCNSYWERYDEATASYVKLQNYTPDNRYNGMGSGIMAFDVGAFRYRVEAVNAATLEVTSGDWVYFTVEEYVPEVAPTGIDLPTELTMYVGECIDIVAKIVPENADYRRLLWRTTNPNVVTLGRGTEAAQGKESLTAVGPGGAIIEVKTLDGDISAVCTIIVVEQPIILAQPESISVESNESASFRVDVKGVGSLRYQWQRKAPEGDWEDILNGGSEALLTIEAPVGLELDGYQYRCIVTDEKDRWIISEAAIITVEKPAATLEIVKQPEDVTADVGEAVKFFVSVEGTASSYQWQYRTSANGTWANTTLTGCKTATLSVSATATRNGYQYRCVITGADGNQVTSNAATLKVGAKFAITSQPESVSANLNDTVKFTVKASGSGLKYQWQYRTSASGTWKTTTLTGSKTATLSATATTARNGYQYRCIITDASGAQLISEAATLNVNAKLAITSQPESVTANLNDSVTFTVKVSGSGLKYQWQYRTSANGAWANTTLTGCKTATLSATATSIRNGYQYRCVITDANGTKVTSGAATLTVGAKLAITTQPESVTANLNDTVKFTVKASGSGLKYQWQYRTSANGTWANTTLTGCKTATLSATATSARNGYQYRCVITDVTGNKVTSNAATLTVGAKLAITQQPADVTANLNDTVKFTVKASGSGLKYQWQYRTSANGTWKTTTLTGSKTATLSATATSARNGYQYRCVITDANGNTVTSNAATLTVGAKLAITTQPESVSASLNTSVKFTVKASGSGLKYQWQYRTSSGGTWKTTTLTGNKTATLSATATSTRNGYQYRCVITDANGNTVTSNAATLTLK